MSNLVPFNEIENMAIAVSKSKLFGVNTPEQAMSLMLLCQAEGLHPGIAMRDYHIIQNRPALKADAMLARFQQSGGSVKWKTYTNEQVTGEFSHPAGGTLEVTWTLAQAKSIGIANKDNWKNYPRAMLRARVASEGIRSVYPGCVVGVYTPEEVQDFEPSKPKDMGMAVEVQATEVNPSLEVIDGAFPLYLPGGEEPYSAYHTPEEWIVAYGELVFRITGSNKLDDTSKQDKLKRLAETNQEVSSHFDSFQKTKLRSTIIQNGGTSNPKVETSLQSQDMEHNEQAS